MNDWRRLTALCLIPLVVCSLAFVISGVPQRPLHAADAIVASHHLAATSGVLVLAQATRKANNNAPKLPTAAQICQKSRTLADVDCYQSLKTWVMPDADPATWQLPVFRLSADEIAQPMSPEVRALKTVRMAHGTTLASPAFELIAAAIRAGRLAEMQKAVDAAAPSDPLAKRNQVALQILLAIAAKDDGLAKSKLKDQLILIKSIDSASFTTRDPEQLTIIALLDQTQWLLSAKSLVITMWDKFGNNFPRAMLQSDRSLNDSIDNKIAELPCLSDAQRPPVAKLSQWQQAVNETDRSRAAGTHSAEWSVHRGVARLYCGESPSQLFFQSPLVSDFEVTCDVSTSPFREGTVAYGMFGVCPYWDRRGTFTLPVLGTPGTILERLQLPRWDNSADVRMVVKNGLMVNYVNGVKIHSAELQPVPDPWLTLHTFNAWYSTSVRNLRITGTPMIPDEIHLSKITDLVNWRADYFDEQIGQESDPSVQWFQNNDEIISRAQSPNGAGPPGLLIHHRPLSFDGDLTYEFFYEPGKSEIHPALGQTIWLLSAGQVQKRRLADFAQNRAAVNADVPVKPLTEDLVPNKWNKVRLSMKGATVVLSVNDNKVDEQSIDQSNTRQFGLFRHRDVSAGRVRAVKWRGDWPKALPSIDDQELAVPPAGLFAKKVWPMKGRLKLDNQSFEELHKLTFWTNASEDRYAKTSEGVELSIEPNRPGSGVTELAWPHVLRGDFDITVSLSQIHLASKTAPEVSLRVVFEDEVSSGLAVIVGQNRQGRNQIMADHIRRPADDSYWFERWERHIELKSGRLRIAREGGLAYLFYAEDEGEFHLLTTYSVGNADVKGVTMWTQIHGPDGNLQAVYKELTINTDEIVD